MTHGFFQRQKIFSPVVIRKIDYPNKSKVPLWLLNYLINNSHYCWENYVYFKDHLECAKCIGGLSATSPLIPLKLYLLVVPPLFFKQLWIISRKMAQKTYDTTHKVVATNVESSICNA